MKNIISKTLVITLLFLGSSIPGISQETSVVVSGEPLAEALVKQWIQDYNKTTSSNITFKAKAKTSDLAIQFSDSEASNKDLKQFSIAKVAILPVAITNSPIVSELKKKGLDANRLKALYFDDF